MTILYICTPSSIHDQKWMGFFAEKEGFRVYAVGESGYANDVVAEMERRKIKLLPPLASFSIKTPLKNHQSIQKLRNYCTAYQIDIVHVLFATPYALWVNYIYTPYIITTRGSDVLAVLPELNQQRGIRGLYFSWLFKKFKRAFLRAEVITSTSELQQKRIKELFNLPAHVVRTGVDVDKIQALDAEKHLPHALRDKRYIFSPRFMSPIYNIAYQIEAISYLPKSITENYTFVFVRGQNFNQSYFEQQKKTLRHLKNINYIILDYLSQEALWATFKRAALTIMTPISDGTPNSALEAMAAECPLMVSDLPYDKALFEHTCIKVRLNNPQLFAHQIEFCLNNPPEFKDAAKEAVLQNGNRFVEMQKLEDLYKSIEVLS